MIFKSLNETKTLNPDTLKQQLKTLIIDECGKEDDFEIADISDTETLVGPDAPLDLDSLDILQISMAIKKIYGVRIEGSKDGRRALTSIQTLADYIRNKQAPTHTKKL